MPTSPPPLPPDAALRSLLPPEIDLWGAGRGLRHPAARPVWFGLVWSRLGHGALAWAHWDRVRLPELQPWIEAERGRVLRELGLHAAAEAREWPALLAAEDPVDRAMLRISLAADAVGLGDVERARRRLAAAEQAMAELAEIAEDAEIAEVAGRAEVSVARVARQRLRLTWVRVEVAWLSGDTPPLDGLPDWDVGSGQVRQPADAAHGSTFHAAKGLLFAAVARDDPRLLAAAADLAPPGLVWAVHLARADRPGAPDAEVHAATRAARAAWDALVPPPGFADAVAETAVARRFSALGPAGTSTGCATDSC